MTAELHKVPGYTRNIVLVGWPADKVPDLAPHTPKVIDAGLLSIFQHAETLMHADLVVFHPNSDILRPPKTKSELTALGAAFRSTPLALWHLARKPDMSDFDIGTLVASKELKRLLDDGLRILHQIITGSGRDKSIKANIVVFVPDALEDSPDSVWKRWLGLPVHDVLHMLLLDQAFEDTTTISALYRESSASRDSTRLTLTVGDTHVQMPRTLPPILHPTGGVNGTLGSILPEGSTIRIHGTHSRSRLPPKAEIFPITGSPGEYYSAVRVQVGRRNTYILPSVPDTSAFVREVVRGICLRVMKRAPAPARDLRALLEISKTVPLAPDHPTARAKTTKRVDPIEDCDFGISMQESGKWRIRFRFDSAHVETAEVKNTTGMRYLVALIEHPNERIHPEYLKSGYAKKHEQMVWVSEQTPAAEMAQGAKTGIDVEASTMRPRFRLTSGSAALQIERMKQELRSVVRQIGDLDRGVHVIRDSEMVELIAVRKKIEKAIATMKRYREVNRHVKSVGKAISRALRLLQDHGCVHLSTHLRAAIAPLEAEILSYEPPPEIRWNVFWTTNVQARKARARQ